jgi:hypothetical protein
VFIPAIHWYGVDTLLLLLLLLLGQQVLRLQLLLVLMLLLLLLCQQGLRLQVPNTQLVMKKIAAAFLRDNALQCNESQPQLERIRTQSRCNRR